MSDLVAGLVIAAMGALVWIAIVWDERTSDPYGIKKLAREKKKRFPRVSKPSLLAELKERAEREAKR